MFNKKLLGTCLLLAVLFISGCNSKNESPEVTEVNLVGNNINNLLNGGYVTEQGEWIFYVEPSDKHYIYAKRKDGTQKQRLIKHQASFLNVIGNQIFYENRSDRGKLYRASITGGDIVELTEEGTSVIFADENWIYFLSDKQRLSRIKHDGTEQEKLTDLPVLHYTVNRGHIYFAEPFGNSVYMFEIETKQLSKLIELPYTILEARYTEDAIFYMVAFEEDSTLYQLYQASYNDPVSVPLVQNIKRIYYVDDEYVYYLGAGEQMKRFNRKTKENEILEETVIYHNMQMIPEYLFYMDHPNKKHRKLIQNHVY